MTIDFNKAFSDSEYRKIKGLKDHIRDMIDGELNRISVSDTLSEKEYLYSVLRENIEKYYNVCCECTKLLSKYAIDE